MSLTKTKCPECEKRGGDDNAGDNLVVYPDNRGAHCFACGYHVHGAVRDNRSASVAKTLTKAIKGQIRALRHRRIDERTCRLYNYRMARLGNEIVEVSNYVHDGQIVAQHVRGKGKKFRWQGDTDNLELFGQHLWEGRGKRVVVTEGEIDCMTISMLWNNRWPVVSLPNGVSSATKYIKANMEFLVGYDEIVLCFDNDEVGRKSAQDAAALLPPGKVRIAQTPRKDANEHLLKDDTQALLSAIYEARQYQPDGILHVGDITVGDAPVQAKWSFPWANLTRSLMGQRSGEMTLWASGTGSGKSTVMRELAYHHLCRGRRVGMLMLEESPLETLDDMIALRLSKPVRQIRAARELNNLLVEEGSEAIDFGFPDDLTEEEYEEARKFYAGLPLYIYDHHGTNEFNSVVSRIEYMAAALECDVIFVDHITLVAAGMERNGSERECIDEVMRKLRSIVERTGVHLDVVSQLNRLDGKAAEEGAQISLKNLRGSGMLGMVPNNVLGIERNQQAEEPEERQIVRVRSLKGRFLGDTGLVGVLRFNRETRRLEEADWVEPIDTETEDEQVGEVFDAEEVLPDES